jgi:hypothetical protein
MAGAMRMGLSVGETTDASSLSDQVKRYKPRVFDREPPKTAAEAAAAAAPANPLDPKSAMSKIARQSLSTQHNPAREKLSEKCIKVVVDNFARFPVHENVPAKDMREITARLPVELEPNVAATHVFDENYWKRCCVERFGWQNCQLAEHGLTWKQLFFEMYLQQRLEEYEPAHEDFAALLGTVKACQDYVFSLRLRQLLAHPDMEQVCTLLPNLTRLDVTYGVKKIGMKYERMLFGMKISDANCLAKCIVNAENLTTLVLSSNLIDDDLLRMLMTGLIKNAQVPARARALFSFALSLVLSLGRGGPSQQPAVVAVIDRLRVASLRRSEWASTRGAPHRRRVRVAVVCGRLGGRRRETPKTERVAVTANTNRRHHDRLGSPPPTIRYERITAATTPSPSSHTRAALGSPPPTRSPRRCSLSHRRHCDPRPPRAPFSAVLFSSPLPSFIPLPSPPIGHCVRSRTSTSRTTRSRTTACGCSPSCSARSRC